MCGVVHAREPLILLLSDAVLLHRDCLVHMRQLMVDKPHVGVATAAIYTPGGLIHNVGVDFSYVQAEDRQFLLSPFLVRQGYPRGMGMASGAIRAAAPGVSDT